MGRRGEGSFQPTGVGRPPKQVEGHPQPTKRNVNKKGKKKKNKEKKEKKNNRK